MKKIILSSVVCATLLFTGCGGGNSSGTTNGTVSGSYYENAIVCFDTNGDSSCTGEASRTVSDSHGDFSLNGTTSYSIIAEILSGVTKHEVIGDLGVDINNSTQTIFAIPANAIAQAKNDGGKVVLSTISTKLYTYVEDHPNESIGAVMTAVSSILGIDKADMLKDFNSATVDASIKATLKAKSDILLEQTKGQTTMVGIKAKTDSFVAAMAMPNPIDVIKAK